MVRAWFISVRDQLLWRRTVGTPLLLAILGVVAGALTLIPWVPSMTLLSVSLIGLLLGLIAMIQEWVKMRRRFRESELAERVPVFAGRLPYDTDLPDTFGTERGTIVHSAELDREMRAGRSWHADMRSERYQLPEDLADIAPYILRRTTGGSFLFNGDCVRMLGDCRVGGSGIIPFQSAGFFDLLCSNELMSWEVPGRSGAWDVRADFLYDEDRRLIPLASSELANVVGVSTLAVSRDRQVLVVGQSRGNHASQGLLAPSGSGSLEPKDVDEDLQTFALNGANREFCEETGVPASLITMSSLIGYGRWLERGAKPEFFGLTLLDGTAEQIERSRRRVGSGEFIYTRRTQWIPLASLLEQDDEMRSVMSVPLAFALHALSDALEEDPDLLDRTFPVQR